jgi:hypothetical protein
VDHGAREGLNKRGGVLTGSRGGDVGVIGGEDAEAGGRSTAASGSGANGYLS